MEVAPPCEVGEAAGGSRPTCVLVPISIGAFVAAFPRRHGFGRRYRRSLKFSCVNDACNVPEPIIGRLTTQCSRLGTRRR